MLVSIGYMYQRDGVRYELQLYRFWGWKRQIWEFWKWAKWICTGWVWRVRSTIWRSHSKVGYCPLQCLEIFWHRGYIKRAKDGNSLQDDKVVIKLRACISCRLILSEEQVWSHLSSFMKMDAVTARICKWMEIAGGCWIVPALIFQASSLWWIPRDPGRQNITTYPI